MNEVIEQICYTLGERLLFHQKLLLRKYRMADMGGAKLDIEDWGNIKAYTDAIDIVTAIGQEYNNALKSPESTCRYWNSEHEDCTLNYDDIRNKAIDECLAVLYKNAGKIISIRFYEQIFDEMKQLKAGGENEN